MKPNHTQLVSFACLLWLFIAVCTRDYGEGNRKNDVHDGTLVIANAWARPAAQGANSAAYLTVHNHTTDNDTLVGVHSNLAEAELHESYQADGMTGMRPADTLVINAGSRLELRPGSFHVMLRQVKQQLITGDSLQLSLQFARADTKEVTVKVQ